MRSMVTGYRLHGRDRLQDAILALPERSVIHGTHSASSHWLTEQCGEKAPKLALAVARTVQTGSASTLAFFFED